MSSPFIPWGWSCSEAWPRVHYSCRVDGFNCPAPDTLAEEVKRIPLSPDSHGQAGHQEGYTLPCVTAARGTCKRESLTPLKRCPRAKGIDRDFVEGSTDNPFFFFLSSSLASGVDESVRRSPCPMVFLFCSVSIQLILSVIYHGQVRGAYGAHCCIRAGVCHGAHDPLPSPHDVTHENTMFCPVLFVGVHFCTREGPGRDWTTCVQRHRPW